GYRAVFGARCLRRAAQRQVIALGPAAGEDDLVRGAVQQPGNGRSCRLEIALCRAAPGMYGLRVAEGVAEIGHHRIQHARIERRGRAVIEIDSGRHCREISLIFVWYIRPYCTACWALCQGDVIWLLAA